MRSAMYSDLPRGFCGSPLTRPGGSFQRCRTPGSRWLPRSPGAVSGTREVALLRQYSSAVVLPGLDGAGDDRGSGCPLALVAAISADVCGRGLRRRLRRAARTAGDGRGGGDCAAAGGLLRAELAGAAVRPSTSKLQVIPLAW